MPKRMTVDDVDAFMLRFKLLLALGVAVIVLPLILYGYYLEKRLSGFEDALTHNAPETLESTDDEDSSSSPQLPANAVAGQVVYVPAYSHIYHGDGQPYLLTITLSVRNTSLENPIVIRSIRYFDTKGNEVKSYLKKPVKLPAMGTTEVVINREDASGGSGANFLVEWYANQSVSQPIIEAVMIDTQSQQGISFARRGTVISEKPPASVATTVEPATDTTTSDITTTP